MIRTKVNNMNKIDELIKEIGELHDSEIEYTLRKMPRLDFDRIRRMANWLTHRRDGR